MWPTLNVLPAKNGRDLTCQFNIFIDRDDWKKITFHESTPVNYELNVRILYSHSESVTLKFFIKRLGGQKVTFHIYLKFVYDFLSHKLYKNKEKVNRI